MNYPEIFISYAWRQAESVAVTEALDRFFQEREITILRDNREIDYKGRIKEYMQRLGKGKYVVVVLSDAYFKSKSCMYELIQLAEHQDFYDRIFPVTVEGTSLYEAEDLLKYVNFWDEKIETLDARMKQTKSGAHLQGVREDLDLYTEIRQNITRLIDFLRNINTHPLQGNNFEPLWKIIQTKIVADQSTPDPKDATPIPVDSPEERASDPMALRKAYLNRLLNETSQVPLSGIDPKAASKEAEAHLNLGAIYTALLTLSTEHAVQKDQRASPFESVHEGRRLSAVAQLDQHARLVLLGDPGSGKSTFVKFVAMCLAGECLQHSQTNLSLLTAPLPNEEGEEETEPQPWRHNALLPVLVILRDFAAKGLPPVGQPARAEDLWGFIARGLKMPFGDYTPHLQQHLLSDGGLVLLDGLDEVPEADQRRTQIKQAVEDFATVFPNCRMVVTSRTYAYQKQDWRLQGFTEATLARFTNGQIRCFVDRWYRHLATQRGMLADDAQGRAERLKQRIFQRRSLKELAERPLLLALMTSLYAWWGCELPDKRVELYAATVDLLLDCWERSKRVMGDSGQIVLEQPSLTEYLNVGRDRVRSVLNALAFQAQASQSDVAGTADVPEQDLVTGLMDIRNSDDVKPGRLVEYLRDRAGVLLPRGVKIYTFPHRTFQEYLAACYLSEDENYPAHIVALAQQDPNRWREVVLLIGGIGKPVMRWSLVNELCPQPVNVTHTTPADAWGALFAGQVLVESVNVEHVSAGNQASMERLRHWLAAILTEQVPSDASLPAVERALTGNILARLGDYRPGVGLREDGLPGIEWCEIPAGEFTMGSDAETVKAETVKAEKFLKKENREDLLDVYRRIIASEHPQHTVRLSGYQISRYPVTNAQYRAFVEDGGYTEQWQHCWTPDGWKWRKAEEISEPAREGGDFDLPNHPVVHISWYEAMAFCRWLTLQLRESGELTAKQEIRLPTEAEWEKATRGTDGWMYPWGNDAITAEHVNYYETQLGVTSAVGCFPRGISPYGCSDMIGNVWEWCWDWYDEEYYKKSPKENPEGPESGSNRVVRGGGWGSFAENCRAAFRSNGGPGNRDDFLGFRLLRTPL